MQKLQTIKNKKLLLIGLPLAVVVPLLIVSWLIGPTSIYIWVGVGLGMLYVSWKMKQMDPPKDMDEKE